MQAACQVTPLTARLRVVRPGGASHHLTTQAGSVAGAPLFADLDAWHITCSVSQCRGVLLCTLLGFGIVLPIGDDRAVRGAAQSTYRQIDTREGGEHERHC